MITAFPHYHVVMSTSVNVCMHSHCLETSSRRNLPFTGDCKICFFTGEVCVRNLFQEARSEALCSFTLYISVCVGEGLTAMKKNLSLS